MNISNFSYIASEYLSSLQKALHQAQSTGEFTPELSYKPILHNFFEKLAEMFDKEIKVIFEPKHQTKAGRPDWRFYNSENLGIYGYIEGKGFDENKSIEASEHSEQLNKYLNIGHNVILTDGVDFVFFTPSSTQAKKISLVKKPITETDWKNLMPNPLLETAFRSFFREANFRNVSEEELIKEVALRAKSLSESVQELIEAPKGSGMNTRENKTIDILHDLKIILEKQHDALLINPKVFSDFIAQVLVFGLLYAHRIIDSSSRTPKETYKKIQKFWIDSLYNDYTEHLRPFRALVEMLGDELGSLETLGTWYEDCRLLLSHIKLQEAQTKTPDYHLLYEKFLASFDPKTRFDFGAFYTPKELATYSVKFAQAIVDKELKGKNLYDKGNKLIDPCCGTGSFLEELITKANGPSSDPAIVGFEILPAPYALANYRLAMIGKDKRYPSNLSIVLTNTLSDDLEGATKKHKRMNLVQIEQAQARELSAPPITLVIGNPPASDSAQQLDRSKSRIIQKLIEDFRPPSEQRGGKQNIQKQLQNEFVKFLRWSCEKLEKSSAAVFVLILPSSFAERPSFKYARKWMAEHFEKIWCLEFDMDGRAGVRGQNLFSTLQGRLLLAGSKNSNIAKQKMAEVFYSSITQLKKSEKQEFFAKKRDITEYLIDFKSIPLGPAYSFSPATSFDHERYEEFWRLCPSKEDSLHEKKYIFERHRSSSKLAPSSLFVHSNRDLLIRRTKEIANEKNDVQELITKWYSGQDKPPSKDKFSHNIRKLFIEQLSDKNIVRYLYRPFVDTYAFISEPVLSEMAKTGGGGTRSRPEVIAAFKDQDVKGIAIAPATKDIGEKLHRFSSFCWNMPDNDLCKRGNAHIFCNRFPQYKEGKGKWDNDPVQNINADLLEKIKRNIGFIEDDSLMYYVYGILCSNAYLDAFEGALFTVAGSENWPRIPIVGDKKIFQTIVDMGRKLAELENFDNKVELQNTFSEHLKNFKHEFQLTDFEISKNTESIKLIEENKIIIELKPLPLAILTFEVAGYNVLNQWLKFNSHRYTRTTFGKENYQKLLSLLNRIGLQLKIIEELDQKVEPIITGKIALI